MIEEIKKQLPWSVMASIVISVLTTSFFACFVSEMTSSETVMIVCCCISFCVVFLLCFGIFLLEDAQNVRIRKNLSAKNPNLLMLLDFDFYHKAKLRSVYIPQCEHVKAWMSASTLHVTTKHFVFSYDCLKNKFNLAEDFRERGVTENHCWNFLIKAVEEEQKIRVKKEIEDQIQTSKELDMIANKIKNWD